MRTLWWIANAVAVPFSALALLFLVNSVNPMQLVFVRESSIANHTRMPLCVTPVGWHESGTDESRRYPLPTFASKCPAIRAWKNTGFQVPADESLRLLWDCDDFRWSEVIVETPDGRLLQQPVGNLDEVVILDVEGLAPAAPHVAIALQGGLSRLQWLMLLMPAALLVHLASFVRIVRRRWIARRERQAALAD